MRPSANKNRSKQSGLFPEIIWQAAFCLLFSATALLAQIPGAPKETSVDTNYNIVLVDGCKINGSFIRPRPGKPMLVLVAPPIVSERAYKSRYTPSGMYQHLALQLGARGYGVFWFDNRGTGRSEGKRDSTTIYTQANDVSDMVRHFRIKAPALKIGLIGHSEGGAVAEVVASDSIGINLLILLAAPELSGYEGLNYQVLQEASIQKQQMGADSVSLFPHIERYDRISRRLYKVLDSSDNTDSLRVRIKAALTRDRELYPEPAEISLETMYARILEIWSLPHQLALKKFKPHQYSSRVKCPVLALYGSKDEKVECEANADALKKTLEKAGHPDFTIYRLPGVNHSFRTLVDGPGWDLADRGELFSQTALDHILHWLHTHN